MSRSAPFCVVCALAGPLLAAVACSDRNPVAGPGDEEPSPPAAVAGLQCTVRVREAALTCIGASAAGVRRAIFGGQGLNVRLVSSGTRYDSASSTLSSNVTVENLTGQVLGTIDGVTAAAEGVRVFFHSGPTVTEGTGLVTVTNADGQASFTATSQPYFQYAAPLAPGDTSAPREWRFNVPNTVGTFTFTVFVAAPVYFEMGWVSVTPIAPSMAVGDTQRMEAALRGVTGRAAQGPQVRWWSSNPAVATVDSAGLVTALSAGTATITATSGQSVGIAELHVDADPAVTQPTLVSLEMGPATVTAEVDSVTFRIRVKNSGPAFYAMTIHLQSALRNDARSCRDIVQVSGTGHDGVYECRMVMSGWMIRGPWVVDRVAMYNQRNSRVVTAAALRAAGAPWRIQVKRPGDDTPPVVEAISIPQASATANHVPAQVDVTLSDPGSAIHSVRITARSERGSSRVECNSGLPISIQTRGTHQCYLHFPEFAPSGPWVIERVLVEDIVGNIRSLSTSDLQAAGYPTAINVVSPQEDTIPPAITAVSLSSAGVVANTADSVSLSISATDERSGLASVSATFRRTGGTQARQCSIPVYGAVLSATERCVLRFNATEAGIWSVESVSAVDRVGNSTTLNTAQLQAAAYPTEITVTP